jgi:hypothetical protein
MTDNQYQINIWHLKDKCKIEAATRAFCDVGDPIGVTKIQITHPSMLGEGMCWSKAEGKEE